MQSVRSRRPDRKTLEALIRKEGNLSRVAGVLDCSRPTLYKWVYQLGLANVAGVDTTYGVYGKYAKNYVNSAEEEPPILEPMQAQAVAEPRLNTSVRLRDSIWQRVKITAIKERRSASEVMEEAAERYLREKEGGDR